MFNDCGVAIEQLRRRHGVRRVAYVDIDAHHGDGVFYAFESDPDVLFADIHEDGRSPVSGHRREHETGEGEAAGTKLNLPLPPGAGDDEFHAAWARVEAYLRRTAAGVHPAPVRRRQPRGRPDHAPGVQRGGACACGGAAVPLADELGHGRVLAMGGGGYNRHNLARAWTRVVESLVASQ